MVWNFIIAVGCLFKLIPLTLPVVLVTIVSVLVMVQITRMARHEAAQWEKELSQSSRDYEDRQQLLERELERDHEN